MQDRTVLSYQMSNNIILTSRPHEMNLMQPHVIENKPKFSANVKYLRYIESTIILADPITLKSLSIWHRSPWKYSNVAAQ